jgi:hypothetical protein
VAEQQQSAYGEMLFSLASCSTQSCIRSYVNAAICLMQWQQALQLGSRQQAAGISSCSRQAGAAAAAWYGHAARRLMSTVATDAAAAAKAGSSAAAAAAAGAASQVSCAGIGWLLHLKGTPMRA